MSIEQENFHSRPVIEPAEMIDTVSRMIYKKASTEPVFVFLGGLSAAGKSTMGTILNANLQDSLNLSMDRYLVGQTKARQLDHSPPDSNLPYPFALSPNTYNVSQMLEDLRSLRQGKEINTPRYDKTLDEPRGHERVRPQNIIIVEGPYVLEEGFQELCDLSLFVFAPLHVRLMRKIARNYLLYGRANVDGLIQRYLLLEEPANRFYLKSMALSADIIVDNTMSSSIFSSRIRGGELGKVSRFLLFPKDLNVNLKKGEAVIVGNRQESNYLSWRIDGLDVFTLRINDQSMTALEQYYDFRELRP